MTVMLVKLGLITNDLWTIWIVDEWDIRIKHTQGLCFTGLCDKKKTFKGEYDKAESIKILVSKSAK